MEQSGSRICTARELTTMAQAKIKVQTRYEKMCPKKVEDIHR
jgi:hypothetical protein